MFGDAGGPSTGNQATTSAIMQQSPQLLGNPPIQMAAGQNNPQMPSFDPQMMNSTQVGNVQGAQNPNVQNMVKALQG